MRILDRYISGQFLKGVVLSLFTFVFIYLIVDFFEHLSKFIDRKVSAGVVSLFYIYEIPTIVVLLIPVALLLSCFLSLGTMARRYELVAAKTAGVSIYRLFLPILCLALGVSIGVLVLSESLLPLANRTRKKLEWSKIDRRPPINYQYQRNFYFIGEKGRIYYARIFDGRAGTLDDIHIYEFDREGELVQRTDARKGAWKDSVWVFSHGVVRRFSPTGEKATAFKELPLPELEETPEDFAKEVRKPEEMNFFELRRYVQKLQRSGREFARELVDLYLKISFPFTNLVIVLIGAPLAANIRRSGVIVGFGSSLLVSFVYWGALQVSKALGLKGSLPPGLTAWLPNLIFVAVAMGLFLRAKK